MVYLISLALVLLINAFTNQRLKIFNIYAAIAILVSFDYAGNFTPLFITNLNEPLVLSEDTKQVMKEFKIEDLKFRRHRFSTVNAVNFKKDKIILPAHYPAFSEAQIKYIILRYIETTLIEKEEMIAMEEAKKEGKNYLFAKKLERRVGDYSKEQARKILAQGGKEQCNLNFKKVTMDCKFIPLKELNLDPHEYFSAQEFMNNLDSQYAEVVKRTAQDKVVFTRPTHDLMTIFLPEKLFP